MTFSEQTIIERDVHCPYCKENKALLISGAAEKKMSYQVDPVPQSKNELS